MVNAQLNTVNKAEQYVTRILDTRLPKNCVFHSKNHTLDVLKNVEIIGKYFDMEERNLNILRLSALFHDIGYINCYTGHEMESVKIALPFLESNQVDKSTIDKISTAILATKVPQNPIDTFSKILCDADLMHLTYANYFEQIDLMRQEWILTGIATFDEKAFHINSIDFFKTHVYHTEYGKQILEPKKKNNLIRIKQRIKDL